jgi:hypothetical protein
MKVGMVVMGPMMVSPRLCEARDYGERADDRGCS